MMRTVLAVVAGFVVWTAVWFAANAALGAAGVLPPQGEAVRELSALLPLLAASVVASLSAAFVASSLAREASLAPALWLGGVLLAVGVFVQAQYWELMPTWYHVTFLLLLLPMSLAGGRLCLARQPDAASLGHTT